MVFFDWNFEIHSFLLGYPRWWNQMTSYIVEIRQVYGSFNYILIFKPWKSNSNQESDFLPSLLVQLQIAQWKLLDVNCLNPLEWEDYRCWFWACKKTDLGTAPEDPLQFIRCKCKLPSKNPCGTRLCLSFRSELRCVQCVEIAVVNPAKIVWRLKMWRMRKNGKGTFLIFLTNFSHYFIDELLINLVQRISF